MADIIRINVNGDPLACDIDHFSSSPEQKLAGSFFSANPQRSFMVTSIAHWELKAMATANSTFAVCYVHPRYNQFQSEIEIDGPGSHVLVFRRDWYARALLQGHTNVPPGMMIFPNFPLEAFGESGEEQELAGHVLWTAFEPGGRPSVRPEYGRGTGSSLITRDVAFRLVWTDPGIMGKNIRRLPRRR